MIGFTANLGERVIPNVVGVDIGCGMLTVPLGKIDINYDRLDAVIRERVPSGMDVHDKITFDINNYFRLWCYESLKNIERLLKSMGTLGGGNHFIEIDEDDFGKKYLIIHTGSRNLGKQVAEYWQHEHVGHDETVVDWIARQMPKIMKAYNSVRQKLEDMLNEEWNKE